MVRCATRTRHWLGSRRGSWATRYSPCSRRVRRHSAGLWAPWPAAWSGWLALRHRGGPGRAGRRPVPSWALLPRPGPGLVLPQGPCPGCSTPFWVPSGVSPAAPRLRPHPGLPAWRPQPLVGGLWVLQLLAPCQAPAPLAGLSQGHLCPDVPFLSTDWSSSREPLRCQVQPSPWSRQADGLHSMGRRHSPFLFSFFS